MTSLTKNQSTRLADAESELCLQAVLYAHNKSKVHELQIAARTFAVELRDLPICGHERCQRHWVLTGQWECVD